MNQPHPSPLDYAGKEPRGRLFSWSVFLAGAIICLGLIAFFVFVVPHFKQLYNDFHLRVPLASQILLSLSDIVVDRFGWLFLALLPVAFGMMLRRTTIRIRWARLLIIVFFFAMTIGTAIALYTPFISLLEEISK